MSTEFVRWIDNGGGEHITNLEHIVDVRRTPDDGAIIVLSSVESRFEYSTETALAGASSSVEYVVAPECVDALIWYLTKRRSCADALDVYRKHLAAVAEHERMQTLGQP